MNILKLLIVYITLVSIYQCCTTPPGWQPTNISDRADASMSIISGDVIAWSELNLTGLEDMKLWLGNVTVYKQCFPICPSGFVLVDGFRSFNDCGVERFPVGTRITVFVNESTLYPGLAELNYIDFFDAAILGELELSDFEPLSCTLTSESCGIFEEPNGTEGTEPSGGTENGTEPSGGTENGTETSGGTENGTEPSGGTENGTETSGGTENGTETSGGTENNGTEINGTESSGGLCGDDSQECDDGTYMGKDPSNSCSFFECLNNDCIHGTKRFGGYCACWSGASGLNCTMGSAKVGKDSVYGSIINNAFSSDVRNIADMYYKIDFDMMLGKSFLRNFTGHPSCPDGSWLKVQPLETNGVPLLESASFSNGSLNLVVSQDMVDGRADGAVFLNDDDIETTQMDVDCYYPRSGYIEKSVEECRDVWTFSVPWSSAKTCSWALSSDETAFVYKGQVIIHNMEWLTNLKQWRIIRSVLRIKIRFQKFIRVNCDTTVFNEKLLTFAITRQIVAIQLGQPALVELTTIINYPYKLYNGNLTLFPTENITSIDFSSVQDDCTSSADKNCIQSWRTSLHLSNDTCNLDGDYAMTFSLKCADGIADNECPLDSSASGNETVINYKLRSEDFCAEVSVDVGIYGYMLCFLDDSFEMHSGIFTVGQRAFFLIKINSDLNPRNSSGELDADFYDESTAVIKFSKLSFSTITVRLESTGEVIRLLEKSEPLSNDFGASFKIETQYGNGSSFDSNAAAFSLILTRELLKLDQNGRAKVTIGAEIEASFDDTTSKRSINVRGLVKKDTSTVSTSPEVVDDNPKGNNGAAATLASFFLIVLTFLF
jgi:hypothetical protein